MGLADAAGEGFGDPAGEGFGGAEVLAAAEGDGDGLGGAVLEGLRGGAGDGVGFKGVTTPGFRGVGGEGFADAAGAARVLENGRQRATAKMTMRDFMRKPGKEWRFPNRRRCSKSVRP